MQRNLLSALAATVLTATTIFAASAQPPQQHMPIVLQQAVVGSEMALG